MRGLIQGVTYQGWNREYPRNPVQSPYRKGIQVVALATRDILTGQLPNVLEFDSRPGRREMSTVTPKHMEKVTVTQPSQISRRRSSNLRLLFWYKAGVRVWLFEDSSYRFLSSGWWERDRTSTPSAKISTRRWRLMELEKELDREVVLQMPERCHLIEILWLGNRECLGVRSAEELKKTSQLKHDFHTVACLLLSPLQVSRSCWRRLPTCFADLCLPVVSNI